MIFKGVYTYFFSSYDFKGIHLFFRALNHLGTLTRNSDFNNSWELMLSVSSYLSLFLDLNFQSQEV